MSAHVVDSSAVLMVVKQEPGFESVLSLLPSALMSAVNAAECVSILVRHGTSPDEAVGAFARSRVTVVPFDLSLAERAGILIAQTKPFGLSLGDRACLALALREGLPVYTADKNWKNVDVGVAVNLVR
jgi:PIN domain nuclease of toxin-antitoxin system